MSKIFISYRRDDSADYAGRLYDRLASHFGHARFHVDAGKLIKALEKIMGALSPEPPKNSRKTSFPEILGNRERDRHRFASYAVFFSHITKANSTER